MTLIYLLRHGATALNREVPYRLQGQNLDPPLDELGIEQAEAASAALVGKPIVAAYGSTLRRSIETAGIVGRPHGLEPVALAALAEADLGRWEGLTWEEARRRDPAEHAAFLAHPGTTPYPGGESFRAVADRSLAALVEIAGRHPGGEVVVVGHNVVNRAVLAVLLGLDIERARGIRQANTGINLIRYELGNIEVETMNATLHLK